MALHSALLALLPDKFSPTKHNAGRPVFTPIKIIDWTTDETIANRPFEPTAPSNQPSQKSKLPSKTHRTTPPPLEQPPLQTEPGGSHSPPLGEPKAIAAPTQHHPIAATRELDLFPDAAILSSLPVAQKAKALTSQQRAQQNLDAIAEEIVLWLQPQVGNRSVGVRNLASRLQAGFVPPLAPLGIAEAEVAILDATGLLELLPVPGLMKVWREAKSKAGAMRHVASTKGLLAALNGAEIDGSATKERLLGTHAHAPLPGSVHGEQGDTFSPRQESNRPSVSARLHVDHDAAGSPIDWHITMSSGSPSFDAAALEAIDFVRQWAQPEELAMGRAPMSSEWEFRATLIQVLRRHLLLDPDFVPLGDEVTPHSDWKATTRVLREVSLVAVTYWPATTDPSRRKPSN